MNQRVERKDRRPRVNDASDEFPWSAEVRREGLSFDQQQKEMLIPHMIKWLRKDHICESQKIQIVRIRSGTKRRVKKRETRLEIVSSHETSVAVSAGDFSMQSSELLEVLV